MKRFDQINVIPSIDIMLVLLAIVLTTASFIATGKLDITLPEAESRAPLPNEPPVELAINQEKQIYLNQQPITLQQLAAELAKLDIQTRIVIRVDLAVPFGHFVSVMDLLKHNDLEQLSVITRQKP